MIAFETIGEVVAIPRAGQFTTEFMRADMQQRVADGKKVYTRTGDWEEPGRCGVCVLGDRPIENDRRPESRFTRLRVQGEGEHGQTCDFFIVEEYVGARAFERLLALEKGARVKLSGFVYHDNSYFHPRTTKVRVLA